MALQELQEVNPKVLPEGLHDLAGFTSVKSLSLKHLVNQPPGEPPLLTPVRDGEETPGKKGFLNLYANRSFHAKTSLVLSDGNGIQKWRACQALFGVGDGNTLSQKDRIKFVREQIFKKSQKEMAQLLGLPERSYQRLEQEDRNIKSSVLAKYANIGINPTWIITGKGPQLLSQIKERPSPQDAEVYESSEFFAIPVLEGGITAGPDGGLLYDTPADYYPLPISLLERKFGPSPSRWRELVFVRVYGDSMAPTILDRELVLVDTNEAERLEPRSGRIYLVRLPDDSVTVKRLAFTRKEGRLHLLCLSDNPDYPLFEFEVDPEKGLKYYVLGRIRMATREFD